jgi:hypothetical protein
MKKKRKPRKRTGTNRNSFALLTPIICLALAFLSTLSAAAKKNPALETYAIVSGSVFDESGYALPDADVTVNPDAPRDASDQAKGKAKPITAISSARGEFSFRVPPGPAQYSVTVSAKGHQSLTKSVSVQDQERVEVTFQLERQSK